MSRGLTWNRMCIPVQGSATNRLPHVAAVAALSVRVLFACISRCSLTFKQWQFLKLAILADVKSGRALSPVFLDVRRTWILDLTNLRWGWHVGSRRQLLLLWLLLGQLELQLLLGCWGWLCGVRVVGVRLYLQTQRPGFELVCICKLAKRNVPCAPDTSPVCPSGRRI